MLVLMKTKLPDYYPEPDTVVVVVVVVLAQTQYWLDQFDSMFHWDASVIEMEVVIVDPQNQHWYLHLK